MHWRIRWHMLALAALIIAALVAGLVAGCGGTTTVTETKTVTTTAAGTGSTATVTQIVTKTVTPAATTTTTTPPASTTTTSAPPSTTATTTSPTGPKTTIKLTIGAGHPSGITWITAIDQFFVPEVSKRVEASTNYKIEWTKAWGSSVAKLGEELEAVETGLLDIANVCTVFEPTKMKAYYFPYLYPFDSPDTVLITQLTEKMYAQIPYFTQNLEKTYNQKWLGALGQCGPFGIISKFPINSPADMKGHKIMAAGPNLPWIAEIGVTPVQSNYNEAYTSMATGVYEGVLGHIDSMYQYKLHEVAPYFLEAGLGSKNANIMTINLNTWNRLPKEVQDILLEVGKEYNAYEAQLVLSETVKAREKLIAAGTTITPLPFDQQVAWANALSNIPGTKAKEMNAEGLPGTEIFQTWQKLLVDAGFVHPRLWDLS